MNTFYLENVPIDFLEKKLLDENKELKVVPASFYQRTYEHDMIPQNQLSLFCLTYGFYCLPTVELCEWLREQINGRSAIEIGAGHGAICKYLGIVGTDSKLQDDPLASLYYKTFRQPTVKYPPHVVKMNALEAVRHYKPEVVIASWVTQIWKEEEQDLGGNMFGVDEDILLDNVSTYIHVGHEDVHGNKRILKRKHKKFKFPWLYSRSIKSDKLVICVWEK